jgi:hypothetical protein
MGIPEALVAEVVAHTSEQMAKDPSYAQMAVGSFVQAHPDVSRFVTANTEAIGGEGVIHTVFHAEVLLECFRRHLGRELRAVRFATLDAAASGEGDAIARLSTSQPALADYVKSNVDTEPVQNLLALIALAFDRVAR